MAIIHVDSNAGGGTDAGTSWTNAYLTLDQAFSTWTTADVVWVAMDHRETWAVSKTFTASANDTPAIPIPIYRINSGTDAYDNSDATVNFETTTANDNFIFSNNLVAYGLRVTTYNDLVNTASGVSQVFEDCVLVFTSTGSELRSGGSTGDIALNLSKSSIEFTNGGQIELAGNNEWKSVTVTGSAVASGLITTSTRSSLLIISNSDFSAMTGSPTLVDASIATDSQFSISFIGCSLPTGYTLTDGSFGADGQSVRLIACDIDGASNAKRYIDELHTYRGKTTPDIAVYRDASTGHEDGDTKLSLKMETGLHGTTSIKPWTPLEGIELTAYIDTTGSKTFTVEAVENFTSALNIDEAWMEVSYLGTANSTKYEVATTKVLLSTTALTAGTGLANWTGEPAGSRSVKFASTVTVNETGIYSVKIFLGAYEAAKVLHYDSEVTVS